MATLNFIFVGLLLSTGWNTEAAEEPQIQADAPPPPAGGADARFFGGMISGIMGMGAGIAGGVGGMGVRPRPPPPPPPQLPPPPPPAPAGAPIIILDLSTKPPMHPRPCLFSYCMELPTVLKYTSHLSDECYCKPQRCECNPETTHAPMKVYDGEPQNQPEPHELATSCNPSLPCIPEPACPRAKFCKDKNDGYTKCVCYAMGACSCWVDDGTDGADGGEVVEVPEVYIGEVSARGMGNADKKEEQRMEKVKRETMEIAAANMVKFNMTFVGNKK